ncbi:MAG: arginine repressor [Clostridiales bacterium]|jgi:transcriptional regulator of arginine metabolism|nr:arginine repressor [Clostridiales bacterium]
MKMYRHSQILKIIEEKDIETQEELAQELRNHGFDVTQATVSRDIKELRLIKVLTPSGTYKYAAMDNKADAKNWDKLIRVFAESVTSMDYANNLIVVKTLSGNAQAAAAAIDALNWPEILGCVAGDDTILVVVRDSSTALNIIERFNKLIK